MEDQAAAASRPRIRFSEGGPFWHALQQGADDYFIGSQQRRRGSAVLYRKTALILSWYALSYLLLVFGHLGWLADVFLAISTGLAVAGIGFNIQHDANHGSYSGSRLLNRVLGYSLDMVGGSSYLWRFKHNVLHHTYPNMVGSDTDIDAGPMLRLSRGQARFPLHKLQVAYVWALYALLPTKWHFVDDFKDLLRGTMANHGFPRPGRTELAQLLAWKLIFIGYALVLPALFHPLAAVLLYFLIASGTLGITLALAFQLAHCAMEADYPETPGDGRVQSSWAEHQVRTSVDFAPRSRFLTWYLGGLNYQIEHHLFPRVSHIHYPALAGMVERTCGEFGIPYRSHRTAGAAVRSHLRFLVFLGQPRPA